MGEMGELFQCGYEMKDVQVENNLRRVDTCLNFFKLNEILQSWYLIKGNPENFDVNKTILNRISTLCIAQHLSQTNKNIP